MAKIPAMPPPAPGGQPRPGRGTSKPGNVETHPDRPRMGGGRGSGNSGGGR